MNETINKPDLEKNRKIEKARDLKFDSLKNLLASIGEKELELLSDYGFVLSDLGDETKAKMITSYKNQIINIMLNLKKLLMFDGPIEEISQNIEDIIKQISQMKSLQSDEKDNTQNKSAKILNKFNSQISEFKSIAQDIQKFRTLKKEPNNQSSIYNKITDQIFQDIDKQKHLISAMELTQDDVDHTFYLPQLSLTLKLRNYYDSVSTPLHFMHLGGHFDDSIGMIPLHPDLLVIPADVMFPLPITSPKKDKTSKKEFKLTDTWEKYINQIEHNTRTLDIEERVKPVVGLSHSITTDLISKGVNPYHLTREKLLKAGYVFVNAIGNGEKFIIDGEINGIDFSKLTILTQEQLDLALQLDQTELTKTGITAQEISAHMYKYLYGGIYARRKKIIQELHQTRKKPPSMTQKQFELSIEQEANSQVFTEWDSYLNGYYEDLKDVFSQQIESHIPAAFLSRGMKALGQVCPFLGCNCGFRYNHDLTFYNISEEIPFTRLTTIQAHLASHGLSERGGHGDQIYCTMKDYYKNFMKDTESTN